MALEQQLPSQENTSTPLVHLVHLVQHSFSLPFERLAETTSTPSTPTRSCPHPNPSGKGHGCKLWWDDVSYSTMGGWCSRGWSGRMSEQSCRPTCSISVTAFPLTTTHLLLGNSEFPSCNSDSLKALVLWGTVDSILLKVALEMISDKGGPAFYSRLCIVEKVSSRQRPVLDLSLLNSYVAPTKLKM